MFCLLQVMDMKGAEEAVAKMNGYQITPDHRLVVEKYVRSSLRVLVCVCVCVRVCVCEMLQE